MLILFAFPIQTIVNLSFKIGMILNSSVMLVKAAFSWSESQ